MDNPEVQYETFEQKLAVERPDVEIYPYISSGSKAEFKNDREDRESLCTSIQLQPPHEHVEEDFHPRPEIIPFIREDLQAFFDDGLKSLQGYWSVYWASKAKAKGDGFVHSDQYRSVVFFRTIEFMIQPMKNHEIRADGLREPAKINIGWRDVQACLDLALKANRSDPMMPILGTGLVKLPGREFDHPGLEGIKTKFRWRIDRALPEKMNTLVWDWRHDAFNGAVGYNKKKQEHDRSLALREYNQTLQDRDPTVTEPGALLRQYIPPSQPTTPVEMEQTHRRGKGRRGKRSSMESSASQELSPSSKRRSLGSQSSSVPQSGSTSPEMGRYTPVGGRQQRAILPGAGPQYAQPGSTTHAYPAYGSSAPAPSPPLGQPHPQVPVQQAPAWGSPQGSQAAGFTYAQPGSAPAGYLGNTAPALGAPYASSTPSYAYGAAGAGPAMTQYQDTAVASWSGAAYPASHPVSLPAVIPSGTNVFQFQVPPGGSAPGGGIDTSQDQQVPAGSLTGWWDEAGNYMRSDQPYGGYQSGYPGQYWGGAGGSGGR